MKATTRRIGWLGWGMACVALLAVSLAHDGLSLTPVIRARLERRSAKARIVRAALIQAEQPRVLTFSPPGGYYDHDIVVTMPPSAPGARVVFTTDGSVPTHTLGLVYRHPLYLDSRRPGLTVLRAREVFADGQWGPVVNATYVMAVRAHLPLVSLLVDPADLACLEAHELAAEADWERPVHITYLAPNRQDGFALTAGLRLRGQGRQTFPKKSFWLYFRREYGQAELTYPLFQEASSFKRLVLDAGGARRGADKSLGWTLLESQLTAELTRAAGGYAPQGQFVLVFLNGQPWGIYNLRERPDRFFLETRDFRAVEVIENRQAQSGDLAHWEALLDFVQSNSLADPGNFAFVQTQVDLENLTDYVIIHMYAASDEWPQRNVVQARLRAPGGRWFWLAWDTARGYGVTGDPDFNAVEWATRSYEQSPHEGGAWLQSTLLVRRLLENDGYRSAFVARAADLLNGVLSAESVTAHIDRGAAQLAPDIHYEESRWPGLLDWQTNLHAMREWVAARPDRMRQELMDKFKLSLPADGLRPPASSNIP